MRKARGREISKIMSSIGPGSCSQHINGSNSLFRNFSAHKVCSPSGYLSSLIFSKSEKQQREDGSLESVHELRGLHFETLCTANRIW